MIKSICLNLEKKSVVLEFQKDAAWGKGKPVPKFEASEDVRRQLAIAGSLFSELQGILFDGNSRIGEEHPDIEILKVIDCFLQSRGEPLKTWVGSSEELMEELTEESSPVKESASRLFERKYGDRFGVYLEDWSLRLSSIFSCIRTGKGRIWVIQPPIFR